MSIILDNCVNYIPEKSNDKIITMGIDWGNTDTVILINEDYEILHAEKIPATGFGDEVDMISKLIEDWNPALVIADQGFGARQIRELQGRYGDRVRGMQYVTVSSNKEPIRYEECDANYNDIYRYFVDKNYFMEWVLEFFVRRKLKIPYDPVKNPDTEWVITEFFNLKGDVEGDGNRIRYGRYGDDHAYHALGYALHAMEESKYSQNVGVMRIA